MNITWIFKNGARTPLEQKPIEEPKFGLWDNLVKVESLQAPKQSVPMTQEEFEYCKTTLFHTSRPLIEYLDQIRLLLPKLAAAGYVGDDVDVLAHGGVMPSPYSPVLLVHLIKQFQGIGLYPLRDMLDMLTEGEQFEPVFAKKVVALLNEFRNNVPIATHSKSRADALTLRNLVLINMKHAPKVVVKPVTDPYQFHVNSTTITGNGTGSF